MSKLQHPTQSDGRILSSGTAGNSNSNIKTNGHEDIKVSYSSDQDYLSLYNKAKKDFSDKVKQINSSILLSEIFNHLQLTMIKNYNSEWDYKGHCPFPDHEDSSPSFYYNTSKNLFHCFGCSSVGSTVEFLVKLTKKSQEEILQDIDKLNIDLSTKIEQIQNNLNDFLFKHLFSLADEQYQFLKDNEFSDDSVLFLEKNSLPIDFFIRNCLNKKEMSEENFETRLVLLRDKLIEFNEDE
jgi:DNA primase